MLKIFSKSDLAQKVVETFSTRIFIIGIGVVTSILVARILGPEGRGIYAIALTISAIGVQFLNLGLHSSNTYYVSKDNSLLIPLIGNSLLASFLIGGISIALVYFFFLIWPALAPIDGLLLILSLVWIPLGLAYMLGQNLLIGVNKISIYNKIEIITKIFNVCIIAGLILLNNVSVITVFLAGLITLGLGLFWAYWKLFIINKKFPTSSLPLFKSHLGYGIRAYLAAFFAFLAIRIDLLMIKYLLDSEKAGYYSVAVNMADLIFMLPTVVGTVIFPKLSSFGNYQDKLTLTKKTLINLSAPLIVLTLIASLLATPAIKYLYGSAYLPSAPAFILLMPGILFLGINTIFMNFFASLGMPRITIFSPLLATILNIFLNLFLIPKFGINGASISSVIAYGFMLMISIFYTLWRNRIESNL